MENTWRYIEEDHVTASYGLACDEYLMNTSSSGDSDFPVTLRLYTYKDHCALAGRFQSIRDEIDIEACEKEGFQYGRRLTGGGAIIMGQNQLGICLTTRAGYFKWEKVRDLYVLFSKPLINALQSFGIQATFRSKNDLEVGGKKIAGLGVHISPEGNVQFHTSLLVDLDIDVMLKVLNIPIQKLSDKVLTRTIHQRMTTINKETNKVVSQNEVRKAILDAFEEFFMIQFEESKVSDVEKKNIQKLEEERYNSEEWIFQNSPQMDMTGMSLVKTPAGLLRTYIGLKGDTIKSVMITGDFFDQAEMFSLLEARLKWKRLDKEVIEKEIDEVMSAFSQDSIINVEKSQIYDAIWMAAQRAHAAAKYTYKGTCYYPKEEQKIENVNKVEV